MPARRDDVSFGYDPTPFMKGLGVVTKGLGNLTKTVTGVAGQITRRFLAIGLAYKGMKALWGQLNQAIPELGKAFQIAGGIFFKNLFWPLRQALVPLLQRMLDWTRDHRTMFIRWGNAAVGIFRAVWAVGTKVWAVLRGIVEAIFPQLKTGSAAFFDRINLIIAKIAVVAEFVSRTLLNIITAIGPELGQIVTALGAIILQVVEFGLAFAKNFITGFSEKLPGIKDALGSLAEAFGALNRALGGLFGKEDFWEGLAKGLGKLTGSLLILGIQSLAIAIRLLATAIAVLSGNWVEAKANLVGIGEILETAFKNPLIKWFPPMLVPRGLFEGGKAIEREVERRKNKKRREEMPGEILEPMPFVPSMFRQPAPAGSRAAERFLRLNHQISVSLTVTEGSAAKAGEAFARALTPRLVGELREAAMAGAG